MPKKNIIEELQLVFFILFVIGIIGWLIWSIYMAFWAPEKDNNKTIKFEVIGISNSENASTLVQIHYKCMQYCVEEYGNYGGTVDRCWEECSKLGKEGCLK
jgi:hypothetical protein